MKRCPECRRDYYDETLLYCLDDGTALLEGPGSGGEPATAALSSINAEDTVRTRAQVDVTDATAIFPSGERPRSSLGSDEVGANTRRQKKVWLAFALLAAGMAAGLAVVAYTYFAKKPVPFQTIKISKLTNIGNATAAQMSPNGEYVAHVLYEGGKNSVRVWDVATKSSIEIIPPSDDNIVVSTFSPDSRYVYYKVDNGNQPAAIFQIPVLGGAPKKIVENLVGGVGFSPDGKQLTFIRRTVNLETSLMIANADGTGEHVLATRNGAERFAGYEPAWSPDGKAIAIGVFLDGTNMTVTTVSVADGSVKPVSSQSWIAVNRASWTHDGSGIIFSAGQANTQSQIWYVSYPGGEARRITNDPNSYGSGSVSLAADSSMIATIQIEYVSNVFVASSTDMAHARPITRNVSGLPSSYILSWMRDGRLVYSSSAAGSRNIWMMNADGTGNRQLTSGDAYDGAPVATADGRYIIFDSSRSGRENIWRMDADGGHLTKLTDGADEEIPSVSPDGQWVIFDSLATSDLRKVSINGGDSVRLTESRVVWPTVSPKDGMIAGLYRSDANSPQRLAIFPSEGGAPSKMFDLPPGSRSELRWAPDGRAVLYVITRAATSSVWSQSIDGVPPKQLVDFSPEQIFSFAVSGDGKSIAFARGTVVRDVVLITDTTVK